MLTAGVEGDIDGPAGLFALGRQMHAETLVIAGFNQFQIELAEELMTLTLANCVPHSD